MDEFNVRPRTGPGRIPIAEALAIPLENVEAKVFDYGRRVRVWVTLPAPDGRRNSVLVGSEQWVDDAIIALREWMDGAR